MKTFKDLGLNPEILKSLEELKYIEPSAVQAKVIPFILESKKDLIALAQTGTGKTAAFGLPILNLIKPINKEVQAIIICPTRELCIQISQDLIKYAKYSKNISITSVYGGERIDLQIRSLKRGSSVVVGTPGRVSDLIKRKVLKLGSTKWVVLDEADEMLDMGFKEDLDKILEQTPKEKQTILVSATMSKSIRSIASKYMNDVEEISTGEKNKGAENVSHEYYAVQGRDRFEALKRILDYTSNVYGILFCRTRAETQEVADKLNLAKYDTEVLHGEIAQAMRTKIMSRFKGKKLGLLVATDVAARGIDVSNLTHVINYNLPDQIEAYTHRSGRTGRANQSGISISLLNPREAGRVSYLENIVGKKFEKKLVPSGADIYEKHVDTFIEDFEKIEIKDVALNDSISKFAKKLEDTPKEEIIRRFIAHQLTHIKNAYQNSHDLNARVVMQKTRTFEGDYTGLKINFGKADRFDIKTLFALINSSKKTKGVQIGTINLLPDHSIFLVESKRADNVVNILNGVKLHGKTVNIIKTDSQVGAYERKRTQPYKRGFNGKKNRPRRSFK